MVFVEVAMIELHAHKNVKDHTIYGNIWHVATFKTKLEQRPEIRRWCYKIYGEPGYNYNTHELRWKDSIQYGEIYFSRPEDLEWFVLRWS